MNVYQKLQAARVKLQGEKMNKSGENKFAGYKYFELADFLPAVNRIFAEAGLCGVLSYTADLATLTVINTESPEEKIDFTSPMSSAALKGCHEVQNLGAVETYIRRYLYTTALEIVEHDALDATQGKEQKTEAKPQNRPVDASKGKKEETAQASLLNELRTHFKGDKEDIAEVLQELSLWTDKDGNDHYLKLADLEKPNSNEKFQRWCGSALGKFRERTKAAA